MANVKLFSKVSAKKAAGAEELTGLEVMEMAQNVNAEATPQAPAAPETAATPQVAAPEKVGLWQRVKNTAATVGQKAGKVVSTTCKVVGGIAIVGGVAYGISKLKSRGQDETDEIIPEQDEDSSYTEVSSSDDTES